MSRLELPWEVQLLLSIRDADEELFEMYTQDFENQYVAREMPVQEFGRFVEAIRQVAEHDRKVLGLLRRHLYPKPRLVECQ
jgi:hypothetical protein